MCVCLIKLIYVCQWIINGKSQWTYIFNKMAKKTELEIWLGLDWLEHDIRS